MKKGVCPPYPAVIEEKGKKDKLKESGLINRKVSFMNRKVLS